MESFYQVLFFFYIYACLGWGVEVAYATVNSGQFVNRGFLNGPYCPIYGAGVLLVAACLLPIQSHFFYLFFGSVALTTLLEFLVGFLLEKIFSQKWWDYTDEPFNFKGYICVKFSLMWGLACVLVIRVIHPLVIGFVKLIPHTLGVIILCVLSAAFLADVTVTLITVLKLKHRMQALERIGTELHTISDVLGENLSDGVQGAMAHQKKSKQELALRRELSLMELDALRAKYDALLLRYKDVGGLLWKQRSGWMQRRIHKAFPRLAVPMAKRMERLRDRQK